MKIEGPQKTSGAKGVSKPGAQKASTDASFSGLIDDVGETAASTPSSGVMSIGSIESLLSLQQAGEDTADSQKKAARRRGELLLEELDKLRIGLLSGGIPVATLQNLMQMIEARRAQMMDPQLSEVLDEIDLRVQVELAKYQRD